MRGIVIKSTGKNYLVKLDNGIIFKSILKGKFRIAGIKSTNPIVVGDQVEISKVKEKWVITELYDRKNYILRKSVNLSKKTHIIAANVDQAILMITLSSPITSTGFIDRFLVAANAFDVDVVLIFNKIDLLDDLCLKELKILKKYYQKIGYKCLKTSILVDNLLTQTIYIGKKMYFIDKMLPNIRMHDKLGYSERQLEWVIRNEKNIWSYIIENELLFSKDETKFRQFIYDGPFVKGLPKEAPTRLMYYIGYKIIENYSQQKNISISELFENNLEPELYLQNYRPENNNIVKKASIFSSNFLKIAVIVCILGFSLLLVYCIKNFYKKNEKKNRI